MLFRTLKRYSSAMSSPTVIVNRTSHFELEIPYPPKNKPVKLCLPPNSTFFNLVESFYSFYITGKITIVDTATNKDIELNTKLLDFFNEPDSKHYRVQLNQTPLIDLTNRIISPQFNINKFVEEEGSIFRYVKELQAQGVNQDAAQLIGYYVNNAMSGFDVKLKTKIELDAHLQKVKEGFMDFKLRDRMDNLLNDRYNEIVRLLDGLKIEKELIDAPIDKKMKMYAWVLATTTLVQFGFFYYTIYCVDWLGWDIMEPLTYSLEVLSMLIVMRFFYKYKRARSFNDVKAVFKQKYFMQKPGLNLRYGNILEKIEELEAKKHLIEMLTKNHL